MVLITPQVPNVAVLSQRRRAEMTLPADRQLIATIQLPFPRTQLVKLRLAEVLRADWLISLRLV